MISKESAVSVQGKLLSSNIYERFFIELSGNEVKKGLLKNKSLLFKNNLLEIGSLC